MRWAAAVALLAAPAAAEIVSARYAEPTARYAHLVLGRDHNFAALEVALADGTRRALRHPEMVFEDTAPRVAEVDGRPGPEVVVVESDPRRGARVAVYGLRDGALARIGATPFVGRANRWYAVADVSDLDGDGAVEVSFVDRPHLAKTLRTWRWTGGGLAEVAALPGVTNHRIGDPGIPGGRRDCGAGPEIVLADADWSGLVAVRLSGDRLTARPLGGPATAANFDNALGCNAVSP
ncbi:VCBS repeat-containing protein [Jannaschia sp. Os4]|nr:VCBS repeat-containing protein [Jannaschia sp. Os4]